jgi:tryptophan-rich sensory protein
VINRYGSLTIFLLIAVLAAFASAAFEAGSWYHQALQKPSWTPPAWLLAVAWALAYLFAVGAAWQAWLTEHVDRVKAVAVWVVLLGLNVAWSYVYFAAHRPGKSSLLLGVALVLTVYCVSVLRRFNPAAAMLMLPYLLWIAFNWLLNLATWTLSGGILSRFL